jgi:16S rRNA processing protein RimM
MIRMMPSNQSDELPVGRIAGIFGIHGELKCDPTNAGRTLFTQGARFRTELLDGTSLQIELASVREHKNRFLIRLTAVNSANEAQRYSGATLLAHRSRVQLGPDEYLDRDLEGCELYDESGVRLGRVQAVEHYPSSDMLVVDGKLVPMVRAFIKSVEVDAKRIVVDLPLGLLDDNEAETSP